MGFGNLFGSSRGDSSTSSTTDNSVRSSNTSADGGAVVAGEGAKITIKSNTRMVDPGSFAFASELVKDVLHSQTVSQQTAAASQAATQDTVAKLAQGSPLGLDWKTLAIPLAVAGVVIVLIFGASRKKAAA